MEEFVNFLLHYYREIILGILVVLEIVVIIVKRRPKRFDEFVDAIRDCLIKAPGFVINAEQNFSDESGLTKKDHVMAFLLTYIQQKLGRNLNDYELEYFIKSLSWMVEQVLEAPTKKGGYGREDEEA